MKLLFTIFIYETMVESEIREKEALGLCISFEFMQKKLALKKAPSSKYHNRGRVKMVADIAEAG